MVSEWTKTDVAPMMPPSHIHHGTCCICCSVGTMGVPTSRETATKASAETAKETSVETYATLTELAYKYNFSSPSFFSDYFRRNAGCSPQEYRLRNSL